MKKNKDKADFYRIVHDEYLALHESGNPTRLRDLFRKAQDSYEQNYIYSLLTNESYGICRYIKKKDLFSVNKELLDTNIRHNIDLLTKVFNHFRNVPSKIDLSFSGKFGYVYVLDNEGMPGLLKIGFTCTSAFERAKQLSTTSVAYPFVVRYLARVRNPDKVEKDIHEMLTMHRVNGNREFFQIGVDAAIEAIEACATYLAHQDSSQRF
jgi:hypothetical protein